jgi:hypothetical protein
VSSKVGTVLENDAIIEYHSEVDECEHDQGLLAVGDEGALGANAASAASVPERSRLMASRQYDVVFDPG